MKTITIIFFLLFAIQIFGQETNRRKLTARLSLGFNYSLFELNKSNWNTDNLSDTLLDLKLKQGSGFQVGYGFIQKINKNADFVTSSTIFFNAGFLEYTFKDIENIKASLDMATVDISFHFETYPFHTVPKFHFLTGPCLKINTGLNSVENDEIVKFKNSALSFDFGFGYYINYKDFIIPIDLVFSQGATNIHRYYNDQYNNSISELNLSTISLIFSFNKKPESIAK